MKDFVPGISIPVPPEPPQPPLYTAPRLPQRPRFPGWTPIGPVGPIVSRIPIGSVISFAGKISSPPDPPHHETDVEPLGWLKCDGREFYISKYPKLFEAIGYRYGGTDKKFKIPDYQGYFLRGVDENKNIDKDDRAPDHSVGSKQKSALQTHAHKYNLVNTSGLSKPPAAGAGIPPTIEKPTEEPLGIIGKPKLEVSDNESRPINIYVYFIIKAF